MVRVNDIVERCVEVFGEGEGGSRVVVVVVLQRCELRSSMR